MEPTDVAYVLDRCDEVLGSTSLRGPVVADVPVDAYWPALAVAAIVVDGRPKREVHERLQHLDATGIKAVAVPIQLAARQPDFALQELREAFDEGPAAPPEVALDRGRAQAVLSALLGAGVLARRAALAGEPLALSPEELEALGVLAADEFEVAAESPGVEVLATALAVEPTALAQTFDRLRRDGLVESETCEQSRVESWRLTDRGRSAVMVWLARCDGLVAGWPPRPPRDVDDLR